MVVSTDGRVREGEGVNYSTRSMGRLTSAYNRGGVSSRNEDFGSDSLAGIGMAVISPERELPRKRRSDVTLRRAVPALSLLLPAFARLAVSQGQDTSVRVRVVQSLPPPADTLLLHPMPAGAPFLVELTIKSHRVPKEGLHVHSGLNPDSDLRRSGQTAFSLAPWHEGRCDRTSALPAERR